MSVTRFNLIRHSLAFLLLVYLALTGSFSVEEVPDSASYLQFPWTSPTDCLNHSRTPGYPALLAVLQATVGIKAVPLFHVLLHIAACLLLSSALKSLPVSGWLNLLITAATLFGCSLVTNVHLISTDAPACSLGIIVFSLVLLHHKQPAWILLVVLSLATMMTILVRPAYLFLIGFVPLAELLLHRGNQQSWRLCVSKATVLFAACLVPILLYCSLRHAVVGHFHVVAFGSQNLSGVTAQFLDHPLQQELSEGNAELAAKIMQRRERWLQEVPHLAGGTNFQAMEDRWDPMIYQVVVPVMLEHYESDPIAQQQRIQALNREIIRLRPKLYLVWIAKAVRQSIRILLTDIVLHPPFFFMILLLGFLALLWPIWAERGSTWHLQLDDAKGVSAFVSLSVLYVSLGMVPIVLTSPPLGRFVDAVGVFIPGALAVVFAHWLCGLCNTDPSDARA